MHDNHINLCFKAISTEYQRRFREQKFYREVRCRSGHSKQRPPYFYSVSHSYKNRPKPACLQDDQSFIKMLLKRFPRKDPPQVDQSQQFQNASATAPQLKQNNYSAQLQSPPRRPVPIKSFGIISLPSPHNTDPLRILQSSSQLSPSVSALSTSFNCLSPKFLPNNQLMRETLMYEGEDSTRSKELNDKYFRETISEAELHSLKTPKSTIHQTNYPLTADHKRMHAGHFPPTHIPTGPETISSSNKIFKGIRGHSLKKNILTIRKQQIAHKGKVSNQADLSIRPFTSSKSPLNKISDPIKQSKNNMGSMDVHLGLQLACMRIDGNKVEKKIGKKLSQILGHKFGKKEQNFEEKQNNNNMELHANKQL